MIAYSPASLMRQYTPGQPGQRRYSAEQLEEKRIEAKKKRKTKKLNKAQKLSRKRNRS